MKFLAIIPARGGSKGIPKKNIKLLSGKPLLHYTIRAAKAVLPSTDICVSTDDNEIKKVAERNGLEVPFIRPKHLSSDTAGTYEVLLHAIDFYEQIDQEYDAIILLQPTSPFRNGRHIKEAIALFDFSIDMVVSVKETAANPYYILFEENSDGFLEKSKKGNFIRRQDCPKVWEYNGAIYIINVKTLKEKPLHEFNKIRKYVMNELDSIDIDTPKDWVLASHFFNVQS